MHPSRMPRVSRHDGGIQRYLRGIGATTRGMGGGTVLESGHSEDGFRAETDEYCERQRCFGVQRGARGEFGKAEKGFPEKENACPKDLTISGERNNGSQIYSSQETLEQVERIHAIFVRKKDKSKIRKIVFRQVIELG